MTESNEKLQRKHETSRVNYNTNTGYLPINGFLKLITESKEDEIFMEKLTIPSHTSMLLNSIKL